MSERWTCCQIGAREHYSIPRALHARGRLGSLLTDAWPPPGTLIARLPTDIGKRLRERYHPDLISAPVEGFTTSLLAFELSHRRAANWPKTIARNDWFERQAAEAIARQRFTGPVFAYSYAARSIFAEAKKQGRRCYLGQIDPAIAEGKLVQSEHERLGIPHNGPPAGYWRAWREECDLADAILVNSAWSAVALEEVGIAREKIRIVPLVYTPPADAVGFVREYPKAFSPQRPMRVLFLGQAIPRKGIARLLDAMKLLEGEPIKLQVVGAADGAFPITSTANVDVHGVVPRSTVASFYRLADVFILPTLSDGFALTQLEAQAWKLPLIASRFCGAVTHHMENGYLLESLDAEHIARAIHFCARSPHHLTGFAAKSELGPEYTLDSLATQLLAMA